MAKNMTQGSPWKHILMFSLPILGGMMLQLLYTTVDAMVVGNFVGEEALGAMNTSVTYANWLLAISTGMSTGSGIVIAQLFGAGKNEELRKCVATVLLLMLGLGAAIMIVGLCTSDLVLRHVLGVPENTFEYASDYMQVYFLGMVFQFLYNAYAAGLRSVGDSGATMKFLLVSSVANVIFDLLFVVAFEWGVRGAALGTVLAQGLSVLACVIYIRKRQALLWLKRQEMKFDSGMCKLVLKLGIPVMIQTVISSSGQVAIQRLINSFGSATMAAVAAGGKIESYALMPNIAFSSGMATYAGQNAGAGDMKRVWKGYMSCMIMSGIICVTMSSLIFIFAEPLVGLFGCGPESVAFGIEYLRFMACTLIIMMALFISRGMLQGVGDVSITTVITFVTLAIRVVLAYWMAGVPAIGRKSIYICMGIDFVIGAMFYVFRLASGKWKKKVVVKKDAPAEAEA